MTKFRVLIRDVNPIYNIRDGRTDLDYRTHAGTISYLDYESNDSGELINARRNYIKNPSFETNLNFWTHQSDNGTATMNHDTSFGFTNTINGNDSVRLNRGSAVSYANIYTDNAGTTVTVPNNYKARFACRSYNANGAEKPVAHIFATGGSSLVNNVTASSTGNTWRETVVDWTNTLGFAVNIFCLFDFHPVTTDIWADLFMLEVIPIADSFVSGNYFDGDQVNCYWGGEPHNSISYYNSISGGYGVPNSHTFPNDRLIQVLPEFISPIAANPTKAQYNASVNPYLNSFFMSVKGYGAENNENLAANIADVLIVDSEGYRVTPERRYILGIHYDDPSDAPAGAIQAVGPYTVEGFYLDTYMPSEIGSNVDQDYFVLVNKATNGVFYPQNIPSLTIDREITNITFNSEINSGYSDASIELGNIVNYLGPLVNNLIGKIAEIYTTSGDLVWMGMITNVTLDQLSSTIGCTGIRRTVDWFYMPTYIRDQTVTAPEFIRDVVEFAPWLKYEPGAIDTLENVNSVTEGVWHKAQKALSTEGIGPIVYGEGEATLGQALEEVLARGYEAMPPPRNQNKVVLQCWNDFVPRIKEVVRNPTYADVKYWIPNTAIQANYAGMNYVSDINDTYTSTFAMYQHEASGSTLPTPRAVDLNLLIYYKLRKEQIFSGAINLGEYLNIIQVATKDKTKISGPGSITIKGDVKGNGGGGTLIPSYFIRAGDVIGVEGGVSSYPPHESTYSNPVMFVVGSTSYNAQDDTLTITIDEVSPIRDLLINRIQVT